MATAPCSPHVHVVAHCRAVGLRIVASADLQVRGHIKETHLPVEGFFECLCRATVLKALPTTEEVALAGFDDAAGFVLDLQESDPEAYVAFLKSSDNHAEWGHEMRHGEPMHVRLDHMIRLIVGRIEVQIGREPSERDGSLSEKEVKKWVQLAFGS